MKVLVACEESQEVCKAFRALGHDAYSCDLEECSGGHPEWHIQGDAITVAYDRRMGWDLMIGHPPCTFLSNSGSRWLYIKESRWDAMKEGALFFKTLMSAPIPMIAIENPIIHKHALKIIGIKYDQIIQPYMFGHAESKATCFWLKGLPPLHPTNNVKHIWETLPKKESQRLHYLSPGPDRVKLRSKTYPNIAKAMATQWGSDDFFPVQQSLF